MKTGLTFAYDKTLDWISEAEIGSLIPKALEARFTLLEGTGAGAEFTGWVRLPETYDKAEYARIRAAAARIRETSQVLIVIGIGGSYLGARAAIEFLKPGLMNLTEPLQIFFAGNSVSAAYLEELRDYVRDKDFSVNVISKSGTTTEPAIAFRIFRELLEQKYGKEGASGRIYATTDKERGALKELADREGYETFAVPDAVGGRYSVLTAVGLLPIAAAGCDTDALLQGALRMQQHLHAADFSDNEALQYAVVRNLLYQKGKRVEILANYEPAVHMTAEWWKQLYGESEGKGQKGIFPAAVDLTTDLHSMGQYIQDGERQLMETVLEIGALGSGLTIEADTEDIDGLNYLAGRSIEDVNRSALAGTMLAHVDGGVPCMKIRIPSKDADSLGQLFYFFEFACGISGYLLGVNPFDQPGVESYKKNMFALLGKPGYEDLHAKLLARL